MWCISELEMHPSSFHKFELLSFVFWFSNKATTDKTWLTGNENRFARVRISLSRSYPNENFKGIKMLLFHNDIVFVVHGTNHNLGQRPLGEHRQRQHKSTNTNLRWDQNTFMKSVAKFPLKIRMQNTKMSILSYCMHPISSLGPSEMQRSHSVAILLCHWARTPLSLSLSLSLSPAIKK